LDVRLAPVAVEPPPPNPGGNVQVEPPPPNPGDNPNGPPPGVPTFHWSADLRTGGGIDGVNMDVAVRATPCFLVADFDIDTGDAADLVTFRSELSADYVDETVRISTGLGNDVVNVDVAHPTPCFIVADYGIDTGDGADLVNFRSRAGVEPPPPAPRDNPDEGQEPELLTLHMTVDVTTGLGSDVVNMDVAAPTPCFIVADVGIDLGAGNDFAFMQLNSAADDLALALHIAGQEGIDVILVQVNTPTPCFFTADIDLAGGADGDFIGFLMAVATQPQQELPVLDVNVKLSGGAGDDAVGGTILTGPGPATGSVGAIVSGDEGNDRLGLFAELSQLLQSSLTVDGGAGFDSCFASQNVTVLNCES
jgi:hypothetical protein